MKVIQLRSLYYLFCYFTLSSAYAILLLFEEIIIQIKSEQLMWMKRSSLQVLEEQGVKNKIHKQNHF